MFTAISWDSESIVLWHFSSVLYCVYADYGRGDLGCRKPVERTLSEENGDWKTYYQSLLIMFYLCLSFHVFDWKSSAGLFGSGTDLISLLILLLLLLLLLLFFLLWRPLQNAQVSVVSNRIGMKLGIVLKVGLHAHRLTQSDYDVTSYRVGQKYVSSFLQ